MSESTSSQPPGDIRIRQIQEAFPELTDFRKCADGSYGSVYIARHTLLEREQAVKIVDCPPGSDREREWHGLLNFCRRIHTHPNLITIYDTRRPYGASYFCYTMELADNIASEAGRYEAATLDARLESQACLPCNEIFDITLGILDGLSVLHNAGMIHRDIKPHNIMIVNGIPKLGDIGLVTNAGSESSIVGTPQYFPTEFRGDVTGIGAHLTQATDLYALAITMYRMMTGLGASNFPVIPEDLMEHSPEIQELNAFIMRAADANPARRYNDVATFRRELLRARERGRNGRRRIYQYFFVLAMLAVGIAIGALVFRGRTPEAMPEDGYSLVNPLTLPWDTDILPANPHLAKQHRLSLQAPEYCYSPWKLLVNGASAIEAAVPEGDERTLVLEAPPELFTPPFEIYYEVQADMSICRMTLQCLDRNGEVVCQVPVLLTPPGVFPEALAPKLATAGIERAQFTWGIRAACENGSLCLTANGNNFGGNLLQLPRAAEPVSFRIKLSANLAGELKLQNLVLFFNR